MRKWSACLVAGLLMLALGASVAAQEDEEPDSWACPEGFAGQQLNVFNWSTYIGEDTIQNFEALCDVNVTYDVYESDDALLARLRQGNPGYDIAVPSELSLPSLVREELLIPLDYDAIPSAENIGAFYRDALSAELQEYALIYLSGTIGLGYNQAATGEISTWDEFFNYEGRVAWIDDSRAMIPIALNIIGAAQDTADPADITAARDYLIAHGDNVAVIATDDGQELLARGEVDMAVEYNGDIVQLGVDCACDDYVYLIPEEGSFFSSGFLVVPQGAQNPELAMVFIDYILDPQVGADIANFVGYPSPNQKAFDLGLIDPLMAENPAVYPTEEILARLDYPLIAPDAEQLMADAWDEVKIALSR